MNKKKFEVIGLGNCTSDFLAVLPSYPDINERVRIKKMKQEGGGEVATALVALARLGVRTAFIGKIGDDDLGKFIKEGFKKENVDVSHMIVEKEKTSLFAFCAVEEKTGKRTIFWHKEISLVKKKELNRNFITSGSLLHLDQYEVSAATIAADWAKKLGMLVTLDIDDFTTDLKKLVKKVNVVFGSEKFSNLFSSTPEKSASEILKLGPELVVLTFGKKGCFVKSRKESFFQNAFKVKVVDTTGAGDVFHGVFIYGILKKWDLRKTAGFASAAAALKCKKIGGREGIPTLKEVQNFLTGRDRWNGK